MLDCGQVEAPYNYLEVDTPVIIGPSDDNYTEVLKKHAPGANTNDWPGFDGTERVLAGNLEVLNESRSTSPQSGQ